MEHFTVGKVCNKGANTPGLESQDLALLLNVPPSAYKMNELDYMIVRLPLSSQFNDYAASHVK